MYIACPECDTKFVVTPDQIGPQGRKVKCSKCSHVWHQTLNDQVKIEPLLTPPSTPIPLGNGVNLPALLPVKIQPYLYISPAVMLILIIFMSIMIFPNALGINSLLNSNSLTIKDVEIDNQQELGKITVSYKVHNISDKAVKMPLVRIRLFDGNNRIIKSMVDDHTKIDMSPNQFIQIKTEFVPAPQNTESLDIMLGNKVDFIIR